MSSSEVPQFIKEIKTDTGYSLVDLYEQALKFFSKIPQDQYGNMLQVSRERAQRDYQAGKLDLIEGTTIFFLVLHLSYVVKDFESQIITLSNLGLMYQNARAYDVAIAFAAEGIKVAYRQNLLELKLKPLNVLSLVYTNTMESEKQTEVMEEVAEIYGELGQIDKKAEIDGLIKQKKEFMKLLGKS